MTNSDIKSLAKSIAPLIGDRKLDDADWKSLVCEIKQQLLPRVVIVSGSWRKEYQLGSPKLMEAINVLLKNSEPFSVENC